MAVITITNLCMWECWHVPYPEDLLKALVVAIHVRLVWVYYKFMKFINRFLIHSINLISFLTSGTYMLMVHYLNKSVILKFMTILCDSMGKSEFYMSYVDMRYLICCLFGFICNMSWSIYDISNLLCSMSETIYVVSKNPSAYFNSFIKWAKIALSVSIFVAPSLLCCICKIHRHIICL